MSLEPQIAAAQSALARSDPTAAELAPLLARAGDHGAGLCPGCFAEVPASYDPFPPPLAVGPGRLAGDGYVVEVSDSQWLRYWRIEAPAGLRQNRRDRRSIGPRGAATIAALPLAIAGVLAAFFVPRQSMSPWLLTLMFAALVSIVNGVVGLVWRPLPSRSTRAFDIAWSQLARKLVGVPEAVPFLTRLAAASPGMGKPASRMAVITSLLEWAHSPMHANAEPLALRAALAVLQVDDASLVGRDRVVGLVDLLTPAFQGRESLIFAEYALSVFFDQSQPPTSGDRSRLRILLLGAAFDAQLTPRDLLELWAVAPRLQQAMAVEPHHRLALLFGVWNGREKMSIAGGETVFQFCRSAPLSSADLTSSNGDLLLVCRSFKDLGPILVTGRGVIIRDHVMANPKAMVELRRPGLAGEPSFELAIGSYRFALSSRPEDGLAATIRELLRVRHESLLPWIERALETRGGSAISSLLLPLSQNCRTCGQTVVVAKAKVGVDVDGQSSHLL